MVELLKFLGRKSAKEFEDIVHVAGLGVARDCECVVKLDEKELVILCSGMEIRLDYSQIINHEFQMDVDDKTIIENNMLNGIIGAATFGVSGAVIGSAPTIRTEREVMSYLVVTYESSDGVIKQFVLGVKEPGGYSIAYLSDALEKRIMPREVPTKKIRL